MFVIQQLLELQHGHVVVRSGAIYTHLKVRNFKNRFEKSKL